jgi:P-type Cu+ transporter
VTTPATHELDLHEGMHEHGGHQHEDYTLAQLRGRLIGAAVLTPIILALSMIPALQFRGWQWVVLALTTPVVTWAAWPFRVATVRKARHGASSMDTLVSIGIAAS